MNSLCELFPQGDEEKADYDRFRALVIQFHQGAENTTTSTSDAEAEVELIVREMREITEKASQTQCHTSGRGDGLCRLGVKSV
jgi:hypothetical protein